MITEASLMPRVFQYFQKMGWKVVPDMKLRGRIPDIVATKDGKIAVVEVKATSGNIENAMATVLHLRKAANLAYLALPNSRISKTVLEALKPFGIGLIAVDDEGNATEMLAPSESIPLPSVINRVFGKQPHKKRRVRARKSSLEHLFRSEGLIQILKLFFLSPGGEFYINEIARRTGLSPPYVAKELATIQRIGLVNRRERGGLVLYSISKSSLIFEELKRIFLKYELIDEIVSKGLPAEKIKYALIYGSFAKGTETASSDIDLLVIGDIEEDILLKAIMKIQAKVSREINYLLWHEDELAEKAKAKIPLIREISKSPIIMIVGGEDEFKRLIE
jgi:predicted nucleotidyltransferase